MSMHVTNYQNVYQVYPGDALYVFTQRGCTMDVVCHLFDFMLLSVIGCTPTWKGTTPDRQGRHVICVQVSGRIPFHVKYNSIFPQNKLINVIQSAKLIACFVQATHCTSA